MIYRIIGTDRRYGGNQSYGEFDNLKDCLKHMNLLMKAFGHITNFRYEEKP